MLELLQYDFMQRALLAGALVGLVCSVVGVFVVLRGISFIGDGIAHSALAGIAGGLFLGVPPLFAAFIFCSFMACVMGYASRSGRLKEDTSIGIFFAASMALGVVLMGMLKGGSLDLLSFLFGSVLTISDYDLYVSLSFTIIVLVLVLLLYKEFVAIVFDEELARISGLPVRFLQYLMFVMIALTVVASLRVAGIVLVSALIVTPAATAMQLSRDIDRITLISGVCGILSVEAGLMLSYYLDASPGATIVLFATSLFLLSLVWRQVRAGLLKP